MSSLVLMNFFLTEEKHGKHFCNFCVSLYNKVSDYIPIENKVHPTLTEECDFVIFILFRDSLWKEALGS